ncbi:hypothetical protein C8R41DRAFT_921352 [Lentinula lateritia]|uniref:Uncharacterized protein n=1 Tax=Lentinula lateritia TaxID=40482 RepID=A0ABQ8VBM3_9AGAR|nr:hypothetical protein C8R41DRAFT_921352 [Lentinula lateritia]
MFVFPAFLAILVSTFIVAVLSEGNVTCSGTALDWYSAQTGETPCKTYERLRQICNSDFEVGVMNTTLPPDICDEQVSDCCCNSVAYALAMLCLNCQQNIGGGSGYDAPAGDYQLYLEGSRTNGSTCTPVTNQTLSTAIQTAVCNEEIRLFDSLYSLFWTDGSWYYQYTQQTINKAIASNDNNTFTHCASTTLNNTSSASSVSVSATSSPISSSSSHLTGGAIGGVVVGTIVGVVGAALIMWFCWWKRKERSKTTKPENKIEPFTPQGAETETHNRRGNDPAEIALSDLTFSAFYISGGVSNSSKSYHDPAVYQGEPSVMSSPSPPGAAGPSYTSAYTGYPNGLISAYGAPSPLYPQSPSQLDSPSPILTGSLPTEKGARLYSSANQPTSPVPTTMGSMSSRPMLSPSGHSYNQSLGAFTEDSEREQLSIMSSIPERHMDGGRIPDEMLDGRLPPAYGDQLD